MACWLALAPMVITVLSNTSKDEDTGSAGGNTLNMAHADDGGGNDGAGGDGGNDGGGDGGKDGGGDDGADHGHEGDDRYNSGR